MTALYHPRPDRWPQVSLKGFFVLVTVFGVWLGVQLKWIRDRHEALRWIDEHRPNASWVIWEISPPVPGTLRLLNEMGVSEIRFQNDGSAASVAMQQRFEKLFPEAEINGPLHSEFEWWPYQSRIPAGGSPATH